jgi:DNA-binding beta-propeller fold protein YncE
MAILLLGSMSVQSFIPDDADGDGVPDSVDACNGEDASYFDRDGDGCLDPDRGARHIEYWGSADTLITYVINATGSPDVGDGSEFTAVQAAMNAWPGIPGTELQVAYGGTVAQEVASAVDQVNLVTFVDDEFPFSTLVLAVGVTTSFTADSLYNGRLFRAGEIVDADMIFNPAKTFKTSTSGPGFGTDIQSTGTHEAGHLYGLSHTSVKSSTMFFVLPAGNGARTLGSDDELAYLKAYADAATRTVANRITGMVTDGQTAAPVPGAIVFAIATTSGDTVACDYTLPDGSYTFIGLADGDYYVAIHPLNGTAPIGFIQPGNINALVEATAATVFVPEYYDAAESNTDDALARTGVAVAGGSTATVNLVTNIDDTAPAVVYTIPPDDSVGVAIDGAYVIRFDEAIDPATLAAAFRFRRVSDMTGVGGNIAVLRDDSLIAFTPTAPLDFDTDYRLTLDTLLTDSFGNGLATPVVIDVTTETEPPLSISSLSPNKGVVNTTVVINGKGFDVMPPATVMFDAVSATVTQAFPTKLVVTVPAGAATGAVTVTNPSDASTSNALTFTLLSSVEIARGYETGIVPLGSTPASIVLAPDDSYAYIGTGTGAEAVVVDPAISGYLTSEGISYMGGLDGVATTPEGRRVYGVSRQTEELVEIMTDPTVGLLFHTVLSSHDLGAVPYGILIDPAGRRAYIATDDAEIQVWDVQLGSATYQHQVGAILSPGGKSLRGQMAVTPDGGHLLAMADAGDLFLFDVDIDSLVQTVGVGADPRDVVVDPAGERAYVSHDDGDVSVVKLEFAASLSFFVQDIATGGQLRGMDVTPAATYIYATDRSTRPRSSTSTSRTRRSAR